MANSKGYEGFFWRYTVIVGPVHSQIHTAKYEGGCALAKYETQTVLAYATSEISGFFTLSHRGKE